MDFELKIVGTFFVTNLLFCFDRCIFKFNLNILKRTADCDLSIFCGIGSNLVGFRGDQVNDTKSNVDEQHYYSFDVAEDDDSNRFPGEFLNSLNPSGLPPHLLRLKIGCPVILLRNIDPPNGLCNGTRLICRGFQRNVIDAEIAIGEHAGKRVFLPRIPLCPSDDDMFHFKLKRK